MKQRIFSLSLLILLSLACSLLAEPERPTIPTPPPTVPSAAVSFDDLPQVRDPVSSIVPAVDPQIEQLLNEVSQQNLVAYVQQLESFGTRHTFSETQRDDYGVGAARRWIFNQFINANSGVLQVQYQDFPVTVGGSSTNQRNVIATIPGNSDHASAIVFIAHYDSRSVDPFDADSLAPGANDNGSGVAVLLEMARLLSVQYWNQTIVLAAFAAEEQGTYGSRYYVQDAVLGGRNFDVAIVNDIVGGRPGIPQSIRLFSPGPNDSNSRQVARYIDFIGGLYLPTFRIDLIDAVDREGRYSDHVEFIKAGVPGLRLTESVEDFNSQHNARDRSNLIDYNYLRQVTQLNLALAANMIGAPPPPPEPIVSPMAEPGFFTVNWRPDPLAAGYVISFRPEGSTEYAPFRYVTTAEAGNVVLTDLDPNTTYMVSLAALGENGRMSLFSPEISIQ